MQCCKSEAMNRSQQSILAAAVVLFLVWFSSHYDMLVLGQNGTKSSEREVCIVLGAAFFVAILFRSSTTATPSLTPIWIIPATGAIGLAAVVTGTVLDVRQLHWIGMLLLLYACLKWSLPSRFSRNVLPALLLLYWVHPVPWSVFGPLQLAMQHMSVLGAEWLVHCVNIPAWADGTILHTTAYTVDVPQACSGMTTSIAVIVNCLGIGLLYRIKWRHMAILTLVGLAQILALNILRIALFTVLAPRISSDISTKFLHDSLGLFLIAGIVLIQLEAAVWRLWHTKRVERAEGIKRGEIEMSDRASRFPSFWKFVFRYSLVALVIGVLVSAAAAALFKRRPYHRSQMTCRLAGSLAISDLASAERAATKAVNLDRSNVDAHRTLAQILTQRTKYDQALAELEEIPASKRGVGDIILKAQSLAGKNKLDEAQALISGLPAETKRIPMVAIISAEMAAQRGDIKGVTSNVVLAVAAPSTVILQHIRALFPYLASKEEWKTIVECDRPFPYTDRVHAAVAVDAYFRMNMISGMERALRRAMATWPEDPMFLFHLSSIAILQPDGKWEDLFAASFLHNLPMLDANQLAMFMPYCFQLKLPHLGWLAYRRLSAIDPQDPALSYTAAQFAGDWFALKTQQLNLSSSNPNGSVDLKPICRRTPDIWPLSILWRNIPLAMDLAANDTRAVSEKYLSICIGELESRDRTNGLNPRLESLFLTTLIATGRYKEASLRLDKLEKTAPERQVEWLSKRLAISDLKREWAYSYELSRKCLALMHYSNIAVSLSQINALSRLRLSVYALASAERLHRLMPESKETTLTLLILRDIYGTPEDAIPLLDEIPEAYGSLVGVKILYDTERFIEADKSPMASSQISATNSPRQQRLMLPMAEITINPPPPSTMPGNETMGKIADSLEQEAEESSSPFISGIRRLAANWFRQRGDNGSSDPDKWESTGRDEAERAVALHNLAMLLILKNQQDDASRILRKATVLLPESPTLWQELVSLSGGQREVITAARKAHPSNSELWLAELVAKTRDTGPGDWALTEIRRATEAKTFPAGTMVRAGDFLRGAGMPDAASLAATYAIKHAAGLIPAYVLGLQCALATNDLKRALACASQAAGYAIDPLPFEKTIIELQMRQGGKNISLSLLNKVRAQFPNDHQWSEYLGFINFQNHDIAAAFNVLVPMLDKGLMGKMHGASVLLAAEAAYIEGHNNKATEILEKAYESQPNNIVVLNNLVYSLAQNPGTLARAEALLPKLLAAKMESASVFDTAATVYCKAGKIQQAAEFTRRALKLVQSTDNALDELHLNAAEVFIRLGEFKDARAQLDIVSRIGQRSQAIEKRRQTLVTALGNR